MNTSFREQFPGIATGLISLKKKKINKSKATLETVFTEILSGLNSQIPVCHLQNQSTLEGLKGGDSSF